MSYYIYIYILFYITFCEFQDRNDYTPAFDQQSYTANAVRETEAPGFQIAQVKAEDEDPEVRTIKLYYNIDPNECYLVLCYVSPVEHFQSTNYVYGWEAMVKFWCLARKVPGTLKFYIVEIQLRTCNIYVILYVILSLHYVLIIISMNTVDNYWIEYLSSTTESVSSMLSFY